MHLSQPAAVEKLVAASGGYDLPSFANLTTLKTWAEEGPPKGTLYHYPNPHNHQILSMAAAPAPPKIAMQIYTQAILTKMIVRHLQGEAMEKTLAWAESEVEGFMRDAEVALRRRRKSRGRAATAPPRNTDKLGRASRASRERRTCLVRQ